MNRKRDFLVQIGLLEEQQFEVIEKSGASITIVKNTRGIIEATFVFDAIPYYETISPIEANKNKKSCNGVDFIYRVRNLKETDNQLNVYIDKFLDMITDNTDKKLLSLLLHNYKINDNCLIIECSSDTQKNFITPYSSKLLTFFSKLGIDFVDIKFNISEINSVEHLIKKQLDSDSKKIQTSSNDFTINDYNKLNYIKEAPTSIDKLLNITEIEEGDAKKLRVIYGKIFQIKKPEHNGPWLIYMKDDTGCIELSVWPSKEGEKSASGWNIPNNRPENFLLLLQTGMYIKTKGKYDYKKNSRLLVFSAYNIWVDIDKKNVDKYDEATKPRIEILTHTKFSSADGLNSASDLIKHSLNNKTPAVGFCDRDNVQAFPDIDNAIIKNDQKPLYGYEVSVLNKEIKFALNSDNVNENINGVEYIVFDLETTSISNEEGEIIEFGAVKIKGSAIIDSIDVLIKPTRPITAFTSSLTHITNEMLSNAKTFEEEIDRIIKWIGDSVLIAHNGIRFDIRFLNKKLIQLNKKPLTNVLIDSMMISRALHPDYPKHRLGYLCRVNKIEYDDGIAHRADFDAKVLSAIWRIQINELSAKGITKISEINCKLLSPNVYKTIFPEYMNIYAKNKDGLKDLYKMVSLSLTSQFYKDRPTLFRSDINECRNNLIICNNPYEGSLWDIACDGTEEELMEEMKFYDYILISPIHCYKHQIGENKVSEDTVKYVIKKIVNIATTCNKKVIATANVYYLNKNMWEAHNAFIYNKLLKGKNHRFLTSTDEKVEPPLFYWLTTQEMLEALSFINDKKILNEIVIDNTYEFASNFEKFSIHKTALYTPKIKDLDENKELRNLVEKVLKEKYGEKVSPLIRERVEKELDIIIGKGYAIIYWISYLLVKKSNDDGYVVGSRGSIGSSFVALLAKISEVNALEPHYICPKCKYHEFYDDKTIDGFDLPIKNCPCCGAKMASDGHNIPFESFLGTIGSPKVPDVDLNFSGECQNSAQEFIVEMFGKTNAFRAGTVMTVADKTAYGYVKKYFEIADTSKVNNDAEISYLKNQIIDNKRSNGLHAGGVIIIPTTDSTKDHKSPLDIHDFCPYSLPPQSSEEDNENSELYATHFDFHAIHDNVLKFDILGHDIPTQFKRIKETSGVSYSDVDFQDHKVIELFQSLSPLGLKPDDLTGETIGTYGIPECATPFTLGMIKKSKPQSFGDLIRISGLSHGTDVWNGNAEKLINEGKQLKDVVSFREDMLSTLPTFGVNQDDTFKFCELVRKGKQKDPKFAPLVDILKKNNVPEWYIESCKKIRYLFPKAHATAYMTQAYIAGWYKIYHPLDFYAAWLSCKPKAFDLQTITKDKKNIIEKITNIEHRMYSKELKDSVTSKEKELLDVYKVVLEAQCRGIIIKPIDLNKSDIEKFIIDREGNSLIAPFTAIDGLGGAVGQSIIEERKNALFKSKEDLKNRTKINKNHFKELIELGTLDGLSDTDQISMSDFFD
ncbi:MAG: PolC-type DNA polymerase III [Mycoplasmoidaceae bacterium]|nr:MAG: PolC-type DNA polymerase III [Mycoplasmoidaceae bacterium]